MVYGGLINQVFPRVYSKEEFAQIKAKVLLMLGEQEAIYNNLQSAIRSARELIPNVKVEIIPAAHHVTAVANPEKVNQNTPAIFCRITPIRSDMTAQVDSEDFPSERISSFQMKQYSTSIRLVKKTILLLLISFLFDLLQWSCSLHFSKG